MLFRYKGIADDGRNKFGYIYADSKREAMQLLKEQGLIAVYSLDQSIDIPALNNIKELFVNSLETFENKRAVRVAKRYEKKRLKEEKSINYKLPSLDDFKNFFSEKVNKKSKDIVIDQDTFDEFKNLFKEEMPNIKMTGGQYIELLEESHLVDRTGSTPIKEYREEIAIDWEKMEKEFENETSWLDIFNRGKIRLKPKEVIMFTKQFRVMLISGITIPRILELLKDSGSKDLNRLTTSLLTDIEDGNQLSKAMGKYPDIFNPTYLSLVTIGEESGNLGGVLDSAIEYLEREEGIRSKVKSASIYPAMVIGVISIVLFFGSQFLIPQFSEIFEDMQATTGAKLPFITEFVFGAADKLPLIMGIILVSIIVFNILRKLIVNVDRWYIEVRDRVLLRIPLIKNVLMSSYMYTIAANVSLMVRSSIGLNDSIHLTVRSINNVTIQSALIDSANLMENEAYSLSESLSLQKNIEPLLVSMAATGEESGSIEDTLGEAADYYRDELDEGVTRLMEMVQPLSILFIALLVVPVVFAIFIPMLDLQTMM